MKFILFPKKTLILLSICTLIVIGVCIHLVRVIVKSDWVILGFNDLGMHCIQPDYSKFLILPPGNNIIVQVFKKGEDPELETEDIIVKYKINNQTDPTKYSNFWRYAARYGYQVPPGVGITGNGLAGIMKLDPTKRYWEAAAVPVTSLTGGTGAASPYQTATITVLDKETKKILAEVDNLVVPVSPEMDCLKCHKSWSNILKDHDKEEKTRLYRDSVVGILHRCNECHADPILEAPGREGIPALSLAMHRFHANKMSLNVEPVCFSCHPGLITQCNRGVMSSYNLKCNNCHGSMEQVAQSIVLGRTPWLQEPACEKCHKPAYRVNPGQLYRRSYLMNGPSAEMNDKILCAVCHNGPHAEWPSRLKLDNLLPLTYQGLPTYIRKCTVCHDDDHAGKVHTGGNQQH